MTATASSALAVTFAASGNCTVTGTTVHLTGAGSCTITASQAGNANYSAAADVPRSFTIHKATVAPHITAAGKTYDGTTDATILTRTLTGVIGSDVVSLDGGTASFADKHAGMGKTVTASGFSLVGAAAGNYELNPLTATATATISQRAIEVSAVTDTKTYDGTTSSGAAPSVTNGSIAVGDTPGFTQAFDTKNVGTGKTLKASGSVNDGNAGNDYLVTFVDDHTGEIKPKELIGSITADDKTYDGTTAATIASRSLSGVISGDEVSYVGGTATFDNRNAGTGKTVTATGLGLAGGDAGNYTVNTSATATAAIKRLGIVVTAVADTKTYDGTTASAGTPTISIALAVGDTPSFTQTFDTKNVGDAKTLTPAGAVNDGNSGDNYDVSFHSVAAGKITPRPLAVSATGINKVYDATTAATVTLSDDRVPGDVLTLSYASAAFADKNVGTGKAVSVSGINVTGTDAGNYTFNTTASTTANITKRDLTVTATAANKYWDGNTTATATLSATPLTGDVVAPISYSSANFDNPNVGSGKTVTILGVSFGGLDGGNYSPVPVPVTTTASILAWTLTGFYQPVDMSAGGMVWNTVKGGSTVPLKFEIFVGSVERTDVGAVKSFTTASVGCSVSGTDDPVEFTTTGATVLRYDGTAGQYIQNWQTPKTPGACLRTIMMTQDGSTLTAYFKLK